MIEEDEDGELYCDAGGCTMIDCRFPSKEIRDQAVTEVLDGRSMFDVTVDPKSRNLSLEDKIEEAALMTARIESDPEREQQLLGKKGPALDELKDRFIIRDRRVGVSPRRKPEKETRAESTLAAGCPCRMSTCCIQRLARFLRLGGMRAFGILFIRADIGTRVTPPR